MTYTGGKGGSGVYQKIISMMPPHKIYIECFLGAGAILRHKKPAVENIGIEIDEKVISEFWNQPLHKNFSIWKNDVLEVLKDKYLLDKDSPKETLVYCDPPYLENVRRSNRQIYRYDMMSETKHTALLEILLSLPCNVMISGYDSELYNKMLSSWRKVSFNTTNRAGQRTTETVWLNFPEPAELHDYAHLGKDYRERQDIKRQRERWINNLEKMTPQKRFALMSAIDEFKASRNGTTADDRATA